MKQFVEPGFNNWRIGKIEEAEGAKRQIQVIITAETIPHLVRTKGKLRYGFRSVLFQNVVKGAKENGRELVTGADANAHHSVWGSTDINKRGELLFDYILSTNIYKQNKATSN